MTRQRHHLRWLTAATAIVAATTGFAGGAAADQHGPGAKASVLGATVSVVNTTCRDDGDPASGSATIVIFDRAGQGGGLYTLDIGIASRNVTVAEGASARERFDGLAAGGYTLTVSEIPSGESTTLSFTIDSCAAPAPTTTSPEPPATEPDGTTEPATTTQPATTTEPATTTVTSPAEPGAAPAPTPAAPTGNEPVDPGLSLATVFSFADPETPVGESTLVRLDTALLATFWVGSLPPAEAVTLWWVVFNQPENCSAPGCGTDDIFVDGDPNQGRNDVQIAAADIAAGYAAGTIVADDGAALMVARLEAGHPGVDVIIGDSDEGLLADAPSAEIHLVARSHGPAVAGLEVIQTTSYLGGCATLVNPPAQPAAPGECADVAFAVHQP